MTRVRVGLFAASIFATIACSSPTESTSAPDAGDRGPLPACRPAETRCDGNRVQACQAGAWSASSDCPGDQTCQGKACAEPTARQRSQAKSIEDLVDAIAPFTAWHRPVDAPAVKAREASAVLRGDGSDLAFFGAAWRTLNAFPQGHQALLSNDATVCGAAMAWANESRFGACGRPSAAGIVVTVAARDNPLGLSVGDVVVDAAGDSGDALYESAYARPTCGSVFPAPSGRRYAGAASFFGSIPAGSKLTVLSTSGQRRGVTVPPENGQPMACTDPFGRNRRLYAEAKTRPDGVAVIRLPSFYPFDKTAPKTQAELDAFVAAYQAELLKVFASVKAAPAIVWDARGNTGGITSVALAIVAGFPTAKATNLSYCRTRTARSIPPAYDADRYAVYSVTPGGPFAYSGKVAIVTDGLAYSAGDYFPFAARKAANALVVGSPTAGAFGGGHGPVSVAGPPALDANYDPSACFDAATDQPLEAAPLAPTVAVELDPKDVESGKDTVLERAVKELGL